MSHFFCIAAAWVQCSYRGAMFLIPILNRMSHRGCDVIARGQIHRSLQHQGRLLQLPLHRQKSLQLPTAFDSGSKWDAFDLRPQL